jgi:YidC/Oxa1 family membrane protein insertase
MDRKGLLIIVLVLGLAGSYQYFISAPKQRAWQQEQLRKVEENKKAEEAAKAKAAAEAPVSTAEPGKTALEKSADPAKPAEPVKVVEPAKTERLTNEPGNVEYTFTEDGGGISQVILKEHFVDKSKGTNVVLNEFGKIAIGALTESAGDEAQTKQRWTMLPPNVAEGVIAFERIDPKWNIKITKRYSLPRKADARREQLKGDYVIRLDVTYENLSETPMRSPNYFLHTGGASPVSLNDQNLYQGVDWWRDGSNHFETVEWFSGGGLIFKDPPRAYYQQNSDLIRWSGVTSQYFTTLVTVLGAEDKTEEDQRRILGIAAWAKRHEISAEQWQGKGHAPNTTGHKFYHIDGALALPDVVLAKKGEETAKAERSFQIYSGPREYRRLRLLDHHEKDVLDYGSFLGIPTGPFSRLLLNSMNGLYNLVGHYALAIVLLTLIVKGILWPLQGKANRNMKKMAALNPQMKTLQEQYKGDPARFQQEMSKMWKKAGVNPLSGCWPIFIQIPIFIGFYNMLGKAVELRHHGFWWVSDLSAPDTVAHLFGIPINPLPLLMAGTMFLQMSLAPQGGDPAQRKLFMFMPLIFIFMCYNFASALALYWTVQNIISIVQLLVNRHKEGNQAQPILVK